MGKDCNHAGDCGKILFAKTTVIIAGSSAALDAPFADERNDFVEDATRLCGGLTFVPSDGFWVDKEDRIVPDSSESFTVYVEDIDIAQRFTTFAAIYANACGQQTMLISTENTFAAVVDVSEATLDGDLFDPPIT